MAEVKDFEEFMRAENNTLYKTVKGCLLQLRDFIDKAIE
jgi:hypothetical protein